MSEYTPTLEDARRTYAYIQGGLDHDDGYKPFYQVHEADFDRMVAEAERKAAEKAWDQGHDAPCDKWVRAEMCREYHPNPYRQNGESNE